MVIFIYRIMKVYRISKWTFLGVCLLILALPVSRHWRLLIKGERATGKVTQYEERVKEDFTGEKYLKVASVIEFSVNGVMYRTYGPTDYEYKLGRALLVFYNKKDPTVNCVATFTGFYLNNYAVLPVILIMVWYAFYLTYNNYRKRLKMLKGRPGGKTSQRSLLSKDEESLSR